MGSEIRIGVQCAPGNRTPGAPTAAPTYRVYAEAGGAAVATGSLPPTERYLTTGLHEYMLRLSSSFAAGRYYVRYAYAISGTNYVGMDAFEVTAGGSTSGTVISLGYLDRPDGNDFILAQTDAGSTTINRGPHI